MNRKTHNLYFSSGVRFYNPKPHSSIVISIRGPTPHIQAYRPGLSSVYRQ